MKQKTPKYDAADYLETEADVAAYLEAALEADDPAFFQKALGTAARAHGMQTIAARAKATRAGLYKALSADGNPEFATVYRVIKALGCRLVVREQPAPRYGPVLRSRPARTTPRPPARRAQKAL